MHEARKTACLSVILVILAFTVTSPALAARYKSELLCDFETVPALAWNDTNFDIKTALQHPDYPINDYDWNTAGYARMKPAAKIEAYRVKNEDLGQFMKGKFAALVHFTIPSEFRVMSKDDPSVDKEEDPREWETGMTLSTETATKLELTNWEEFASVSLDLYNPSKDTRKVYLRISDSGANTYVRSADIETGAGTFQIPLKDLDVNRINVKDIRMLTIYMDTVDLAEAPELYVDNLQLNRVLLAKRERGADEEEEEFEFDEDEDEEEDEDEIRIFGGRLKQLTLDEK